MFSMHLENSNYCFMGEVMAMQLGVSICVILYEYSGKHIALNMFIADVGGELKQILLCL